MAAVSLRTGDAEAALERERELWEAFKSNDRERLERLIDPLALDVGPWGARTRDEVVAALARMTIETYAITDLVAREDDSVSIVTYRSAVDGAYAGTPFRHRTVYVTSVWRDGGTDWRLVHRCEAPAEQCEP